jgi:hypothetical protein
LPGSLPLWVSRLLTGLAETRKKNRNDMKYPATPKNKSRMLSVF